MTPKEKTKKEDINKLEELQKVNKELEGRVEELENNWKRALADYKNLEKRVREEKDEFIRFANQVLITRLLFIYDNLELLLKHSDDKGLEMIVKEFENLLKDESLQEIDAENQDFDENLMEAVEMIDGNEGKVMEVTQKGYTLRGKVLRPAKVKVGTKKEKIN